MTQITNSNWQALLTTLTTDNETISRIESRLSTDSDANFATDIKEIQSLETKERAVYGQLNKICPDAARDDLDQLLGDLEQQSTEVARMSRDHTNPSRFQSDLESAEYLSQNSIPSDINALKQDN